ncbi:MAG: hypothetical protein V8R40_03855 [Dysosmobacter sp.]
MDDEFAKDVSEFDTLKDLKADLKKKITEERQKAADQAFEDALMEQVAADITADIPDAMVENQARQFLDNFKMQIAQQGIPYDQYMKMTGMEEPSSRRRQGARRASGADGSGPGRHHQGGEPGGHRRGEWRPSSRSWPTSTAWIWRP